MLRPPKAEKLSGDGAFYNCESLTSVEISDSVTSIWNNALFGFNSLTSITFKGTVDEWNEIEKGYHWHADVPATKVVCDDGEVEI